MICPDCGCNEVNVYNDIKGGMIIATKYDTAKILIECPKCRGFRYFGYNVGSLYEKQKELGDSFDDFIKGLENDCIQYVEKYGLRGNDKC